MHRDSLDDLRQDFLNRGFTRRSFGRILSLLSAAATAPFYNEMALAQLSGPGSVGPDAVRLNANENPLGPCTEAAEAMRALIAKGGRYMFDEGGKLAAALAEVEGVPLGYVDAFAGSSDPLHRSVLAFTTPTRGFVTADPGFEAGELAARFIGAKVVRVPLTKDYQHDVKAMATADPNAGLIYVCNPNNPTGTLTTRSNMEWLLANKPPGCVVLIDEAYIHFSHSASSLIPAVREGKDLIVLRTFSKLYGMAGLRAAGAFGRPDLLERMRQYGTGMLPVTGKVGARVSLKVKDLVPERRLFFREAREDVFDFLEKHRFSYIPSESNKFMVDVKRPGREIISALATEKVYVGRVWPSWPTHIRVTVGTPAEMAKFQSAFLKVMA